MSRPDIRPVRHHPATGSEFIMVGRNRENYDGLRAALGISLDTDYTEFEVSVPHNEPSTIKVTFLPTAEQLENVLSVMTAQRNRIRRSR